MNEILSILRPQSKITALHYPIDTGEAERLEVSKKGQFYNALMFKKGVKTSPELVTWAATYLPDQFKLKVLDDNVASLRRNIFSFLKIKFEAFVNNPSHSKSYFKYDHDHVHYYGQIYTSVWTDTTKTPYLDFYNFNIKVNDDGFVFSPSNLFPGSIDRPEETRHQARGWALLSNDIVDKEFPNLQDLAQQLLGNERITYRAAFYNFAEEMVDIKFGTNSRITIVYTFERCELDREIVLDKWRKEDAV